MKAYLVQSAKAIEPLGDHPRDCLIGNRPLAALQEEALRRLGLAVQVVSAASAVDDAAEHLVVSDRLYFTAELLQEFISRSRQLRSRTRCALKPGVTTLRSVVTTQDVAIHPDRVEYDLRYVPAEAPRGAEQPVIVEPDGLFHTMPMPAHMLGEAEYKVALTDRLLVGIDHWANLWFANIGALLAERARLRKASKTRRLLLALRARSLNRWEVLRRVNRIGAKVDIHPTAYVEGSTIGDRVQVGAGSVIRTALVGNDTVIGNNATIEAAVIGESCNVRNGAIVQYSVLYPGTFTMSRLVSASLCGRDSFLGDGTTITDFRLDGRSVTVLKDGVSVDTQNPLLGCCLGHGVYLAAGCVLAPGRMVPNSWRIAPDEQRVIRGCPPDGALPGHRVIREVQR
jgi:carbonic anhydrase/acetyltransferase-like protein (isoleucine patch superfamily)